MFSGLVVKRYLFLSNCIAFLLSLPKPSSEHKVVCSTWRQRLTDLTARGSGSKEQFVHSYFSFLAQCKSSLFNLVGGFFGLVSTNMESVMAWPPLLDITRAIRTAQRIRGGHLICCQPHRGLTTFLREICRTIPKHNQLDIAIKFLKIKSL